MEHAQELLSQYGVWLMLIGALIEGETFLIIGGVAASKGLFHLPGLILLAVIGSLIHDHGFFFIGRFTRFEVLIWKYKKKLSSYRKFKKKINKGLDTLDRYGVILIIGFRFMYGLRTIVPTVIGLSSISIKKFFILDLIGATIWSCAFILGGYYFGGAIEHVFTYIHDKYKVSWTLLILASISTIVIIISIWIIYRRLINKHKTKKLK